MHYDRAAWIGDLKLQCLGGAKIVAVVDSCTSKIKHIVDELTLLATTLKDLDALDNTSILVPVGKRFDLLSMVVTKVGLLFPQHKHFVISIAAGESCLDRHSISKHKRKS